jgi:hypothetical protein
MQSPHRPDADPASHDPQSVLIKKTSADSP